MYVKLRLLVENNGNSMKNYRKTSATFLCCINDYFEINEQHEFPRFKHQHTSRETIEHV